jgi:diguanylate cyclase
MTFHDPSLHGWHAGLLGWLRRGRAPEANPDQPAAPPLDASAAAQLALVADIGRFLLAHDLEVSSFTLPIAHDYLANGDSRMGRLIDRQIQQREPITVDWLEETMQAGSREDDRQAVSALMIKLQNNLEAFGRTTTAAKSAASDYSSALEVQVDEMRRTDLTTTVIGELAHLATVMLDRTRELEKDMARSELQSRTLQRSLDQARRNADKDHLTGLPNRRAFEARLTSEYVTAQENQEPLCVAFCDIDNFKAINDTHGHEAGDRILRNVAQNLARISNDTCHVARHGGEEFVVLLRGMPVEECREMLDEARALQAERRLVNRATDLPFGKVTFSAGIADIFAFCDPRSALQAADQALYRAKEEGRNRVVIADQAADSGIWP